MNSFLGCSVGSGIDTTAIPDIDFVYFFLLFYFALTKHLVQPVCLLVVLNPVLFGPIISFQLQSVRQIFCEWLFGYLSRKAINVITCLQKLNKSGVKLDWIKNITLLERVIS